MKIRLRSVCHEACQYVSSLARLVGGAACLSASRPEAPPAEKRT